MNEFELIEKFFNSSAQRPDVVLGIGDDCAIVEILTGQSLAVTTDTLINGVHFPQDTPAIDVGYKSLAVNLSDLAAMGARPSWVTLALTLPSPDEHWLEDFCRGFFSLANQFNLQLIGGDLTHGALSITVQAHGFLPPGAGLTRAGAEANDLIFVSGTLGDAGFALQSLQKKIPLTSTFLIERLNRPTPRIHLGEKILSLASSAIDVSDGLAGDLKHILKSSGVGAIIDVDTLPLSSELTAAVPLEEAISLALNAGDDYELCFTVPPKNEKAVKQIADELNLQITCIGKITAHKDLELQFKNGKKYNGKVSGYQHF